MQGVLEVKQYVVDGNTVSAVEVENHRAAGSAVVIEKRGHRNQLYLYRTKSGQIRMDYIEDKSKVKPLLRLIPGVVIDRICYTALVLALVFVFCNCYYCIKMDTQVAMRLSGIEQKRSELAEIKLRNDDLQAKIDSALNPDAIYREATQEYGMVLPNDSEVITYEKTSSGYVRTYDSIPEAYQPNDGVIVSLAKEITNLFN